LVLDSSIDYSSCVTSLEMQMGCVSSFSPSFTLSSSFGCICTADDQLSRNMCSFQFKAVLCVPIFLRGLSLKINVRSKQWMRTHSFGVPHPPCMPC